MEKVYNSRTEISDDVQKLMAKVSALLKMMFRI